MEYRESSLEDLVRCAIERSNDMVAKYSHVFLSDQYYWLPIHSTKKDGNYIHIWQALVQAKTLKVSGLKAIDMTTVKIPER